MFFEVNFVKIKRLIIKKEKIKQIINLAVEKKKLKIISSLLKGLSIIEYKTPSTLNEWTPNIFVDITAFLDIKYKMLEKFGSQQHHWYFNKEVIQHFHSDFQSYKKGYKFVEQFKLKQLYKL